MVCKKLKYVLFLCFLLRDLEALLSKILARAASFPYESLGHGYGFRFTKFRSEIEQIKKRPLRVQNG